MEINSFIGKLTSGLVLQRLERLGLTTVTPRDLGHSPSNRVNAYLDPVQVSKWSFFTDLILGQDLGLAKSYIDGKWNHGDLTALFRHLATRNKPTRSVPDILAINKHIARIFQLIRSSNSIWWASRNIRSHYDLGNEFFAQFLDPTMTYSCGIFENSQTTLLEAQERKISTLIAKTDLSENDHILDIGCGWGGLILKAVRTLGVKATGVTLSMQQHEYTNHLMEENGLADKTTIELLDYRLVRGKFQHIFSVEMLEAVGHKGIRQFFEKCACLLNDAGTLQIQVITVPDERYESYRTNCDFIQKFIFPGGLLPSLGTLNSAASQNGFVLSQSDPIGHHYATTLRHWKYRMRTNRKNLFELGYSEKDLRRFEYYFSYCEGAFLAKHIQNHQLTYTKK